MKVAISGITGLIGKALGDRLVARGDEVVGISRQNGHNLIRWDVDAGEIDVDQLAGVEAVVHLAGEPIDGRWTKAKKARILDSRTKSTALLATALCELDVSPNVFVSGSAIGYYGDTGSVVVDESSPAGSTFMADVAQAWERAAQPAVESGMRVVYPRTGIVLDRSGGALKPLLLATRLMIGGPLGDGSQIWSWISLHDEVAALVHLLDTDIEGPVNLTAPHPVTQRVMAKELGAVLGRPSVMRTPKLALKLALGELAEALIFTSADVRPKRLVESGFSFEHRSIDLGLRAALSD